MIKSQLKLGRLAQLVRAFGLHPKGRGFESLTAHHFLFPLHTNKLYYKNMKKVLNVFLLLILFASFSLNIVFYLSLKEKQEYIDSVAELQPSVAGVSVSIGDKNVVRFTRSKYMENNLNKLYQNYSGTYSLYLRNLKTSETLIVNPKQTFYSASLFKIPVVVAVMQDIEDGKYKLTDKITYTKEFYFNGSGSIQNNKEGTQYTIEELINKLLKESDNAAQAMLMSHLTNDTPYALMPNSNRITTTDVGNILEDLYSDAYLKEPSIDYILEKMTKTLFDDRLNLGLPTDVVFSHKIGNWAESGSWHDCGIMKYENNAYAVCLMSKGTTFEEFTDAARKTGIILSDSLFSNN